MFSLSFVIFYLGHHVPNFLFHFFSSLTNCCTLWSFDRLCNNIQFGCVIFIVCYRIFSFFQIIFLWFFLNNFFLKFSIIVLIKKLWVVVIKEFQNFCRQIEYLNSIFSFLLLFNGQFAKLFTISSSHNLKIRGCQVLLAI